MGYIQDIQTVTGQKQKKVLYFQKHFHAIALGTINQQYILLEELLPPNMNNDSSLDYERVTDFTDTTETLKINKTFWEADLRPRPRVYEGRFMPVLSVGLQRTGGTSGNVHLSKVELVFGKTHGDGSGEELETLTIDCDVSVSSADEVIFTVSDIFSPTKQYKFNANEKLYITTKLYCYVETTESGTVTFYFRRGTTDSYIILPIAVVG